MSTADDVTNPEIILWALHLLNGDAEVLDVEDVFLKSFELAPKRFSWRTHSELPDYKKTSKALQEAEAKWPTFLVKTADGLGRQLAVDGQRWIAAHAERFHAVLHQGRAVREPKQRPRSRMLAEVEKSDTFERWRATGAVSSEKWRVAEMLRCSPDSGARVWHERLESLRAAAYTGERHELLHFLDSLSSEHPEWFGR